MANREYPMNKNKPIQYSETIQLLPTQQQVYNKIISSLIQQNKDILLYGHKGVGKHTLIDIIVANTDKYNRILAVDCSIGENLAPIFNAIKYAKTIIKQRKITLGIKIPSIFEFSGSYEEHDNETRELDTKVNIAINWVNKFAKKDKALLIFHKYEQINAYTKKLIELIKRNPNIQIIFIDNDYKDIAEYRIPNLQLEKIKIQDLSYSDANKYFISQYQGKEILTENDKLLIFNFANKDIYFIKQITPIIIEYKESNQTNGFHMNELDAAITKLLLDRVYAIDDSEYWKQLLHFSSIINNVLKENKISIDTISQITNQQEPITKDYLQKGAEVVFNLSEQDYHFMHNLIYQTIFDDLKENTKIEKLHKNYYNKVSDYYQANYPHKYAIRAEIAYAIKDNQKADIYQALWCIIQIREDTQCILKVDDIPSIQKIKSEHIKDLVKQYKILWTKYNIKRTNGKQILDYLSNQVFSNIPSVLCAEFDLLFSFVAIEALTNVRNIAVDKLEKYISIESVDGEKDIWIRICMRKANMYSTVGRYETAKQWVQKFYVELENSIKNQEQKHLLFYKYKFNTKSNFIYDLVDARMLMKQAVDYFKNTQYISSYMVALYNYLGVLIQSIIPHKINCQYIAQTKEILKKIENLKTKYGQQNFPKMDICECNKILANYFINEYDSNKAIKQFEKLISEIRKNTNIDLADTIFYVNNLSIFYAKQGLLEKAIRLLEQELNAQNACQNDSEGYYSSPYINLYVFKFLLSNDKSQRLQHLNELNSLSIYTLTNMPNYQAKNNQLQAIKQTMSICIDKTMNADEWENAVFATIKQKYNKEHAQNYTIYDRGFYYDTVYNWVDNA